MVDITTENSIYRVEFLRASFKVTKLMSMVGTDMTYQPPEVALSFVKVGQEFYGDTLVYRGKGHPLELYLDKERVLVTSGVVTD